MDEPQWPLAGGAYPLAAGWNGKFWALLGTYVPPGYGNPGGGSETTTGTDTDLTGVSCTAPDQCTLVGYVDLYYGRNETLAERWNGRGWAKQQPRPTPLAEVSYISSTSCMAVAGGYSQLWAGTNWSSVPLTSPTKTNLTALSCPEKRTCVAIGTAGPARRAIRRQIVPVQRLRPADPGGRALRPSGDGRPTPLNPPPLRPELPRDPEQVRLSQDVPIPLQR